jgi:RHS repeat-associated protein
MNMPGRSYSGSAYKYGFNGQEQDDEVSGTGNSYTAEFWQYDSRLGRRFNTDPVVIAYLSPYNCFQNSPIEYSDPDGDFVVAGIVGFFKGAFRKSSKREFEGGWFKEARNESVRHMANSINIYAGIFAVDRRRGFFHGVYQILSRLTWELPQTIYSLIYAQSFNIFGHVHKVGYQSGATYLYAPDSRGPYMVGNVIIGQDATGEVGDLTQQYWQGKQRNSRILGPLYFIHEMLEGREWLLNRIGPIREWIDKSGFIVSGKVQGFRYKGARVQAGLFTYNDIARMSRARYHIIIHRRINQDGTVYGYYRDALFLKNRRIMRVGHK